jgi:hypothetical protein
MSEDGVPPLPAAGPDTTSLRRFGAAFALASIASVAVPFVITPIIIMATGERLAGMGIGVPLGIIVGWLIFPFVAWRPFRAVHLLALPIVGVAAVAGLMVLPEHWLTSDSRDDYGIFGAMINYGLCALAGYGGLTWLRNKLLRGGTDLFSVEFVKALGPRFGRVWRILRSRDEPDRGVT